MLRKIALFLAAISISFLIGKNLVQAKSKDQDVKDLLEMQATAWNKGDLQTFMTGYLNSDNISYTSGGKVVWGYQALKDRYEKRYGNKADTMGKLAFSDLKTTELGKDHALCIGHWHLVGKDKTFDGVFSLILRHTKTGWKVIHDHTSLSVDVDPDSNKK